MDAGVGRAAVVVSGRLHGSGKAGASACDRDAAVKTVCLSDICRCARSSSRFALLSVGGRNMTGSSANWQ